MSTINTADENLFAELRALEIRLTNPGPEETRESLGELFVPAFREYGSSGREYDAAAVLDALLKPGRAEIRFEDFRAVLVARDVVLLTYVSHAAPGRGWKRPARRSSLWRREAGAWRIVFHQGTWLADEPASGG
jgi:hypothetical protein